MTRRESVPSLLSEPMLTVLDNAPVCVYVSALDDCTLLYANRSAKDLFASLASELNDTCYHAVGFDSRCPFCQVGQMSRDNLFVREFRHSRKGRCYQLSGKIVDWNGRPAHIEYAVDITDMLAREIVAGELSEELKSANEKM